jgi:cation:H+ antiporter
MMIDYLMVLRMIEVILNSVTLAFSLGILAIASQFAIKSVEDLTKLTRLSEASVGFAILSVMTSVPEICVAFFSMLQGKPGFSVGDVLGSNVFNVGIVVGILATIGYLKKCSTDLLGELVDILFLSSLIPIVLVMFGFAGSLVGLVLIGIFVFSIYRMTKNRKRSAASIINDEGKIKQSTKTIVLKIVIGIAIVIATAELTIFSASNIAVALGVPPILIGAKIIAIGTSMPELALDLTAARRGRMQLAIGDAVGSNLTNITLVLGIVLLWSPFGSVDLSIFAQILPFVLITTLILWRYLTKGGVSQFGGIALIIIYILFQAVLTI